MAASDSTTPLARVFEAVGNTAQRSATSENVKKLHMLIITCLVNIALTVACSISSGFVVASTFEKVNFITYKKYFKSLGVSFPSYPLL